MHVIFLDWDHRPAIIVEGTGTPADGAYLANTGCDWVRVNRADVMYDGKVMDQGTWEYVFERDDWLAAVHEARDRDDND